MTVKSKVKRLLFLKPFLNLTCLLSFTSLAFLFLFSTIAQQNQYALPSLILAVWCLLFSALLSFFVNAPEKIATNETWLSRFRYKLTSILFKLFNLVFIFLTLALLYVTVKLLRIWL